MEYFILESLGYLMRSVRPALLLYAGIVCIRWARGREISIDGSMIWAYLWVWWLVTLLRATGFAGLDGGWHWSIFNPVRFGIGLYGEGSRALLLAILMFAPCGFLTPSALRGIDWDMTRTLALGVLISFLVEMLRMPAGGTVELGGLILSAAGTTAGYLLYDLLRVAKGGFSPLRKDANLR
jgi:glycopeptide antibiotics resistance protein